MSAVLTNFSFAYNGNYITTLLVFVSSPISFFISLFLSPPFLKPLQIFTVFFLSKTHQRIHFLFHIVKDIIDWVHSRRGLRGAPPRLPF